jgi:hypothetical protein
MKPVSRTSIHVRRFLEKDAIATLNILGILENEPQVEVFVDDEDDPKGVLVKGPWFWYVHTEDEAFLVDLCQVVRQRAGFYQFSGVWRPLADRIKARFPLVWDAPCDLYCLPEGHPAPPRGRLANVDIKDAEIIDEHYTYRHARSLEKIRTCILQRPSSAIYVDGRIVSWLLVHEDNSLGIMYTLEEQRRKGFALEVSLDLMHKQLAAGRTPYLQIRNDNSMSPGLAAKCGFVQRGQCAWFGVIAGIPPELIEGGVAFRQRVLLEACALQRPDFRAPRACLVRFLYLIQPELAETSPVVEIPEAEWLAFAAQGLQEELLRAVPGIRLLGERREGALQAAAALLVDEDDGFELLWYSSLAPAFLQGVLERAKAMKLGTVFVHVEEAERGVFEGLGFLQVYTEEPQSALPAVDG